VTGATVEFWRGGVAESRHVVHVAVADARGLFAHSGNPTLVVLARSTIKMIQALPLIEDGAADAFSFTSEELALCCASHSGEPEHIALARSMLDKLHLDETALACGPHAPFASAAAAALARSGELPTRIHNNCSGKHAGMLALARVHDWTIFGYQRADHPVQQRMAREVGRWAGLPSASLPVAVDGCGVATFALELESLATSMAEFGRAAIDGASGPGPARVLDAMRTNPFAVGGTGRLDTQLIEITSGRVIAKVGAEGMYCAIVPEKGIGIALKVQDGAGRAAEPALLAALHELGAVNAAELDALARFAMPRVLNTRGEPVGEVRTHVGLTFRESSD
jgi:L-asparaginase II